MSRIFKPMFDAALNRIIEDGHKPHIVVYAEDLDLGELSQALNPDGTIILNISGNALGSYTHENGLFEISMAIRGKHQKLRFPEHHVLAMYAFETAQDMQHLVKFVQPEFVRLDQQEQPFYSASISTESGAQIGGDSGTISAQEPPHQKQEVSHLKQNESECGKVVSYDFGNKRVH